MLHRSQELLARPLSLRTWGPRDLGTEGQGPQDLGGTAARLLRLLGHPVHLQSTCHGRFLAVSARRQKGTVPGLQALGGVSSGGARNMAAQACLPLQPPISQHLLEEKLILSF